MIQIQLYKWWRKTLTPLLGVFQNLLASKINDGYGFDLIQSIMLNIPIQPSLQSFYQILLD